MIGEGKGSLESITLDRLKRVSAGLPREKDGRPVSDLDRLLAQASLTHLAVRHRGGSSLFSIVNGLLSEAMLDCSSSAPLGWMAHRAQADFFATVMSDIVSGNLIVRDPLHFFPCNAIPDIQSLASAREGLESMAILVRFAVKISEARDWLEFHKHKIPEWLEDPTNTSHEGWAASPVFSSTRRRNQVRIVQKLIEEMRWPPLAIPFGGKTLLKSECIAGHPNCFTKDSFENCWDELREANLVRTDKHDLYSGKETKPKSKR